MMLMNTPMMKSRNALSTVSSGMVRPITCTLRRPRRRLKPRMAMTATVVGLRPPPQLPGFVPMNMNISTRNIVAALRDDISTVLKPAVRDVMDMKREEADLCKKVAPIEGLFHSRKNVHSAPMTISPSEQRNTILVCRENLRAVVLFLKSKKYRTFEIERYRNPRDTHSFPTRRSSASFIWN